MLAVLDWIVIPLPALACLAILPGPGFKWLKARFDDANRATAFMGMALGFGGPAVYLTHLSPAAKDLISGYIVVLALVAIGNTAFFAWPFPRLPFPATRLPCSRPASFPAWT